MSHNNPVRIAVIMGKYTPGGIKSVIMNYYRKINREKYQFDFFIYDDSPDKDYQEIERLGGKVYTVPNIKHIFSFMYILRRKLKGYKIVHSYLNALNFFPMMAAATVGVSVRIAENLSTAHPGEAKTVIKNILKLVATSFSTHIAANAEYAAIWLYGKKRAKTCFIIRNALDLDIYKFNQNIRNEIRNKYKIGDGLVIGHIGRFAYQKNHIFLIDIFNEILKHEKKSILLLVGYGELESDIRKKINDYGIGKNVLFMGKTEDLIPLYNAMDCFVLPSFYEGLPVVGIEAQALGVPCFFSDEITKETKITPMAEFISLKKTAKQWADIIISKSNKNRIYFNERDKNSEMLKKAGYDLKIESKRLEVFYDNVLK